MTRPVRAGIALYRTSMSRAVDMPPECEHAII